ncbi:hypothetical protein [Thalassomonas haliotis]|uniref:Uncharacterized protein n=1 Tax=Thalassomonas haliotis TaxID=485448 RepID=A0ABY7V7A2_9GAMM|nr:hypothetical protein [Thalassomonas haliotis]WDE09558.1 hypothetical protein H3N35_14560 [Thalassomonas haliotis]
MGLTNSIFTSFIIIAVVWAAALYQPKIANAFPKEAETMTSAHSVKTTQVQQKSKVSTQTALNSNMMTISGVSQTLKLDEISAVWQRFDNNKALYGRLKALPEKIYVYYRDFSSNYQMANVTIGYDQETLSGSSDSVAVNMARYNTVLAEKHHSKAQVLAAWQNIDYSKAVDSVLEVHSLDKTSQIVATTMLVSYK